MEIDLFRSLHPKKLCAFLNENTRITRSGIDPSFYDCIDGSVGFYPYCSLSLGLSSYDVLSAHDKEEFSVYQGSLSDLSGEAIHQDARHIGAVADMGAVMVETICRTPYLPFRVYLRFFCRDGDER